MRTETLALWHIFAALLLFRQNRLFRQSGELFMEGGVREGGNEGVGGGKGTWGSLLSRAEPGGDNPRAGNFNRVYSLPHEKSVFLCL